MAARTPALEAAFQSTEYWVELAGGPLLLRVGVSNPIADRRLRAEAGVCASWVIVTAWNPHSEIVLESQNMHSFSELHDALKAVCPGLFHTRHRDPKGVWPEERGLLLPDFSLNSARALGRRYRQHALLIGELGKAPALDWLTRPGEPV